MSVEKKYCLTYPEFYLLAGSAGIRNFYGFSDEAMQPPEDKEIVQLLFRLTKKNFLKVDEKGYEMIEPIRNLLEGIRLAPKMLKIFATDNRVPMRCIYFGEEPVIVELGGIQGNFLKLYNAKWNELLDELCQDGTFFLQNISDDILYQKVELNSEELEKADINKLLQVLNTEKETASGERLNALGALTALELHHTLEGKIRAELFLVNGSLYDIILEKHRKLIKAYYYSKTRLSELIRKMQEE